MSNGGSVRSDDWIIYVPLGLLLGAVVVALGVIALLLRYA